MPSRKKREIAKILAIVVIMAGLAVIAGWIFDVSILKSISPDWISMKFDTAIAFVMSGITLYFITRSVEGEFDKAQVVLSITSLVILLLMGTLFISQLFRIHTGLEHLFIKESAGGAKTVSPGMPSFPTMINFILVAVAGIVTILNSEKLQSQLKVIGLIVGLIGGIAVVGYLSNVPLLYYFIKDVNSAMACHTAILFMLLGIGFACQSD